MDPKHIRNFCIIAHIDHGKSTLADRFLELTGAVRPQAMKEQFLDQMDLERERGITIKGKAVRLLYRHTDGQEYHLNLIDTPGHVDFSYEVSRALTACEGAILVVDATQGVQAQTIANAYMAMDHDLRIIPVVNKIDMAQAQPEAVRDEMVRLFGFTPQEVLFVSAKEGTGVPDVLKAVIERVPPPRGDPTGPLRALVFDSVYNPYKGILAYVRVFDGSVTPSDRIYLMATARSTEVLELGVFTPGAMPTDSLSTGQVGYIATGLKDVRECRVGDTITLAGNPASQPLPGYKPLKPMVFAGLFPSEGEEYHALREALEKLQLNDAALSFEPENSPALGFGFRCGFLGLLHMEIVQERLEREYNLDLIATAPSVAYQVLLNSGEVVELDNPSHLPPPHDIQEIREPWLDLTIVTPARYIGAVMELVTSRRGQFKRMEYIQAEAGPVPSAGPSADGGEARVVMEYALPLSEMLVGFYDQLKSRTQGYASMDYVVSGYRPGPLVKLDILVNQQPVDALSAIIHRDRAYSYGKALIERLKELIPRQLFEVPLQAAIGGRVIARETIRPMRKDVLAKCYGGDVTRKRKLLEKQKEGKKRLKRIGRVEVPQEAFLAILKVER